jgi:BirA family biotin operon repressor/biotin-[acetyl-CoA-carboxylase] ligase
VIGIGINCRRDAALAGKLGRKIAFLDDFESASRNTVVKQVTQALVEALDSFEQHGLDGLRAEWQAMDAHAGQRLRVRLANGRVMTGLAGGLADDGALRLVTRSGVRAVRSGRVVSARAA